MVSMWSGSCRAVILSLLLTEFSALYLHRQQETVRQRCLYNERLWAKDRDQILASLVKTSPLGYSYDRRI